MKKQDNLKKYLKEKIKQKDRLLVIKKMNEPRLEIYPTHNILQYYE